MPSRIKNFSLAANEWSGSGDDTAQRICRGTEGFTRFCLHLTQGEARVFVSLDGENYFTKQTILCQEPPNSGDAVSSQAPVYVAKATANVPAWFYGDYKAIKIQQEGGTQPLGTLSAAGDKWS